MIVHIFRIFLLLAPTACKGSSSDVDLLKDLTVDFTSHFLASCIKLLHPYDEMGNEGFQMYYKLYKKLVPQPYWTVGIYSYENFIWIREQPSYRRYCSKPLKVTVAEHASKEGFAKVGREMRKIGRYATLIVLVNHRSQNLAKRITQYISVERVTHDYPMSNTLWLIILKDVSMEEYFENAKLPFDTQIVTATVVNSDLVDFHELYRVGTGFPTRIKYFGNWTKSKGMNVSNDRIYSRRSDLEGKVFNVGFGDNWPVVYLNSSKKVDGYFPKIWFELEGLMNITSKYKFSRDGTVGRHTSSGNWTGLMGMLLDKEIDIIIADLTISEDRSDVIDFARPLITSSYQVYFGYLGMNLEWTAVFRPFATNVWLSVIGYILVASISLSLCNYISLLYGLENYTFKHFTPIESFFFVLQSLCQQGYEKVPKSSSSRIIFLMSYLVSAILIPSYSASLISSLANQTPIKPFDSLKEMVKDGSYHLIVGRNTAEFVYFSKAKDEVYKNAYEKLVKNVPPIYGRNLNRSTGNEYAILCEWPKFALFGVELLVRMKIENSNQTFCRVSSFSQPVSKVYQSFGMRKNSPYTDLINYHLNRMLSMGLVKRFQKSVLRQTSKNIDPDYNGVDLAEIFHYFLFLSVGIVLTTMLLFYEKIHSRYQRERRKKLEMHKNYQKLYHSHFEYYR